jgi:serine/threonine-protein kinase
MTEQVRVIGRYALHAPIASGGMATVHFGRLLGPVGFSRTVAIKRLHPHFARDPEFVAMFLDEARLAGRVRHPNVVSTRDVAALDGELFLVMEYVQGESLARLITLARERDVRIPDAIVASIMADLLHGLHAAHEATDEAGRPLEIVHRDVSPHNVLVGIDGSARVLDFGVAKAVGRLQMTREGQLKGKVAYMAPEQVQAGPVTRAADIYAASAVFWEALTRSRLFDGQNEAQILTQILRGKVRSPRELAPDVPSAVEEIVLRGLAQKPTQRFESARAMARALEGAMRLATPTEVSEWVEAMAGRDPARRAAVVSALENTPVDVGGPSPRDMVERVRSIASTPDVEIVSDADRIGAFSTPPSAVMRRLDALGGRTRLLATRVLRAGGLARLGAALALVLVTASVTFTLAAPRERERGGDEAMRAVPRLGALARTMAGMHRLALRDEGAAHDPLEAGPDEFLAEPVDDLPARRPSAPPSGERGRASLASTATMPVRGATPRGIVHGKTATSAVAGPMAATGAGAPTASHSGGKPKVDCSTPYTVDAAGHKKYKIECL